MPAPVTFNVSVAPLDATFEGTPAQLASAIAERITVTPAEPWSSFQNGGSIPTSNVGPVLYEGREWRVWNSSLGAYVPHTQDGAGLKGRTVPLNAMANLSSEGSLIVSDDTKAVAELSPVSSTDGQVLTIITDAGKKKIVWANTFVPAAEGNHFETTLAAATPQVVNTGGVTQTVAFAARRLDPTEAFDTANHRWGVTAGEVWFVYAQVQLTDSGAATTNWDATLAIRRNGVATNGIASYLEGASMGQHTLYVAGLIAVGAGESYLDVGITVNGTGADVQIDANSTNTRFGGYRVI